MALLSRPVTDGICLDTNAKLTAAQAESLYKAGVRYVWRYVFFGAPRPGDLDAAELAVLTAVGLTVLVVQHVRNPGWHASDTQGNADGLVAVANAIKAGYVSPDGQKLSLALDMEGCATVDTFDHANAWCAAVRAGGYLPVVYVGYASGLKPATLDKLGADVVFWCDFAPFSTRPMPTRGYSLHQQPQSLIANMGVDVDAVLQAGVIVGLGQGDVNVEPTNVVIGDVANANL